MRRSVEVAGACATRRPDGAIGACTVTWQRRALRELVLTFGLAVGFFVLGRLGLEAVVIGAQVSPLWPPAGLAAVAVYLRGPRALPGVWIGAFAVSFVSPAGFWPSAGMAAANTVEAGLAGLLWSWWALRPGLSRTRDVVAFATGGVVAASAGGLLGAGVMELAGLGGEASFLTTAGVWWMGDAIGCVVVAPVFLARGWPRSLSRPELVERAGILLVFLSVASFVFLSKPGPGLVIAGQAFMIFPVLAWVALRTTVTETAWTALLCAVMAAAATVVGQGPFAGQQVLHGAVVLQLFLALLVVTALLLAASRAEQLQTLAQLTRVERLATLGRVSAAMAHEVNTPLGYLLHQLEVAARRLGRQGIPAEADLVQARESVEQAAAGAHRVRGIVDDLRSFAREGREERRPVQLAEVIEGALVLTRPAIERVGTLVWEPAVVPRVHGNAGRLEQVLVNLLMNAAQSLPAGGSGQVRLSLDVPQPDRVRIVVEDTGKGIPLQDQPHVFEPFFTTKLEDGGTGLGLPLCQEVVAAHGGEITLRSVPGRGTRVEVLLPALVEATLDVRAEAALDAAAPTSAAPFDRPRVLVIDDEPRMGLSLKLLLGDVNEVTTTTHAEEALGWLRAGQEFEVILCDLQMPGMGGMALQQALDAEGHPASTRLVFVTGGAVTDAAREFLRATPNRVLRKPVPAETLRTVIADLARQQSTAA